MKKLFFLIAVMVMIGSSFFGHSLMNVMAEGPEQTALYKYYTSIEIQQGDSLWNIAEVYGKGSGRTTKDYVKELKRMNNLGEDTIHAGSYLTVFYYAGEK